MGGLDDLTGIFRAAGGNLSTQRKTTQAQEEYTAHRKALLLLCDDSANHG